MRIEQVTFTRFLAAISIVIYHYALKLFPFSEGSLYKIFKGADTGVSYFFILSGFVMMFAYGKRASVNVPEYFKNRFARIYPVYLLAVLLVFIHYILNKQAIDISGLLLNIFVLQAWVPAKAISFNSPGWSLTIEFFFYILFPFILKYIFNKINKKALIPILLFWLLSQLVFNLLLKSSFYQGENSDSHNFLYYFPLMHLNEFLLGNLAGLYFINMDKKFYGNYDWVLILLVAVLIILLIFPIGVNFHNGLLAILFVPLIFLLSSNTGFITRLFNLKLLIFLGEISYGVYILQYPVFTWCRSALKFLHITNPYSIFYISTLALIIFSGISYHYFETPIRNKIKNFRLNKAKVEL